MLSNYFTNNFPFVFQCKVLQLSEKGLVLLHLLPRPQKHLLQSVKLIQSGLKPLGLKKAKSCLPGGCIDYRRSMIYVVRRMGKLSNGLKKKGTPPPPGQVLTHAPKK